MISMKHNKIIASWNKAEPSDAANDRMLSAILEMNRSARSSAEAAEEKRTPGIRNRIWLRWGAVAAAVVLLLTGTIALSGILKQKDTKGVYIPRIDLSAIAGGEADMAGLIVYRGGVYTETESYYGEAARRIDPIVGEHLGYAVGSLNEWSTRDEYAKEFASTYTGDVYAVNGYDTSFRVCIRDVFSEENGESAPRVQFFERLEGITLSTGKDLFEDRLCLSGRIDAIQWMSHRDWNLGGKDKLFQNASFDQSVWDSFLNAVDRGEFIHAFSPKGSFYENQPYRSIYETPNQAHLFLSMKDGTTVELRLIEGGYVGYQALGWYFVKIPGDAFDAVFDACGGTHLTNR